MKNSEPGAKMVMIAGVKTKISDRLSRPLTGIITAA